MAYPARDLTSPVAQVYWRRSSHWRVAAQRSGRGRCQLISRSSCFRRASSITSSASRTARGFQRSDAAPSIPLWRKRLVERLDGRYEVDPLSTDGFSKLVPSLRWRYPLADHADCKLRYSLAHAHSHLPVRQRARRPPPPFPVASDATSVP